MKLRDLYQVNSAWTISTLLCVVIDGEIMRPMTYAKVQENGYDLLEVTSFYKSAVNLTNPSRLEIDFEDEWTDFTEGGDTNA